MAEHSEWGVGRETHLSLLISNRRRLCWSKNTRVEVELPHNPEYECGIVFDLHMLTIGESKGCRGGGGMDIKR